MLINPLPELTLTPEEKRVVGHYPSASLPGVLDRRYSLQLSQSAVAGDTSQPSAVFIPSGRRVKLYAITFSGDVEAWAIMLRLNSGEQLFQNPTRVTALLNAASTVGTAAQPDFTAGSTLLQRSTFQPWTYDPPLVLEGTQSLTVDGTPLVSLATNQRTVLNLCFWVWEFPISQVRLNPRGV